MDPLGNQSTFANTGLGNPEGVAVDASGNVYVANVNGSNIEKFSPAGTDLGAFATTGINDPGGMHFGPDGNLYVTNINSHNIEKYSPTGTDLGAFATGLNGATDLAFDTAGNLYVALYFSKTVEKFSSTGTDLGAFITTGLSSPDGLAFDAAGNLYVSNDTTNVVEKYNSAGVDQGAFAQGTEGLAFDKLGNLYAVIGASFGSKVEKFSSTGTDLGAFATGLSSPTFLAFGPSTPSTINFDSGLTGSTITLTTGQLVINQDMTISGLGAAQLTVSGNNASRVFEIDAGTVTISGLTITGGSNTALYGGGVWNRGTLTLDSVVVTGNTSISGGGGLRNDHLLTITNSTITANVAQTSWGGGIDNVFGGQLFISNSQVTNNSATGDGGGIDNYSAASANLNNVVISGNAATNGGGMTAEVGSPTISATNVTLSSNTASGAGGGIYQGAGTLTITGSTVTANTGSGIELLTQGSVVGGSNSGDRNVISGNTGSGIVIRSAGAFGNVVQGNYIGLAADGVTAQGNQGDGVLITSSATGNSIDPVFILAPNVISGNAGAGIHLSGPGTTTNQIFGNYIGTDASGTLAVPNAVGVLIDNGANSNTIGGTGPSARNIISGNTTDGVRITDAGTTGNLVEANYIGTDRFGSSAVSNTNDGVLIENGATGNTIGGDANTGAANVISGNINNGVEINNASGNTVQGNTIGTDASGSSIVPNGTVLSTQSAGVALIGAGNNTIGGDTNLGALGNLLSGNANYGILLSFAGTTGNLIEGNEIGTNASLTGPIRNNIGINIINQASLNTVGGGTPTTANVISGNNTGIILSDIGTNQNLIQGNYIGTDAQSDIGLGNIGDGVRVELGAANNTIGGTTAGTRNVISANQGRGVYISNPGTTGNVVEGNYVGTDTTGTVTLGNVLTAIQIDSQASGNTIGGSAAGDANVIAASGLPAGIVSWYRADGNAFDSVSGDNGTLIGGVTYEAGQSGQAFNLDGTSGYVQIANQPAFNPAALTLEAWVKPTSQGTYQEIISKYDSSSATQGHSWYLEITPTGQLQMGVYATPTNSPNQYLILTSNATVISAGAWQHVAGTFDPITQTITLYVNGVSVPGSALAGSSTVNPIFASATPVRIGADVNGSGQVASFFGGLIDDAAIYGRALSANEINAIYSAGGGAKLATGNASGIEMDSNAAGNVVQGNYIGTNATGTLALGNSQYGIALNSSSVNSILGNTISGNDYDGLNINGNGAPVGTVSWYQAEGNATDSVGGNNGTLVGGASFGPGVNGQPGDQAFTFNGSGQYVNTNKAILNTPGPITVQGWVNPTTIGNYQSIVSEIGTENTAGQYQLRITPTGTVQFLRRTGGNTIQLAETGETVAIGVWTYVVGVYDGTNLSIYLNGIQAGASVISSVYNAVGTGETHFGAAEAGAYPFDGSIDEAALYNRALSSAQILNIYNSHGAGLGGATIQGNKLGTNAAGTAALGNGFSGVAILGSAGNTIGGASAGLGNVISGDFASGVVLDLTGADYNTVQGNYIGTDGNGTVAIGNSVDGVFILNGAASNTIGGTTAGARNIISGNSQGRGIEIDSAGSINNVVEGNYIGVDASGNVALPNQLGILISTSDETIGGTVAGAGNVISGNQSYGVYLAGNSNTIVGNSIGTTANGAGVLGNGSDGIIVLGGASNNTIGTTQYGQSQVSNAGDLGTPYGIVIAASGQIYVATDNNSIVQVDPVTGAQTILSSGGLLQGVYALALNGNSIVATTFSSVVSVDIGTGAQTLVSDLTNAGEGPTTGPDGSLGIVRESAGTYLISDFDNNRILRVDPATGNRTVVATGGSISAPELLALQADGTLLVASSGNGNVVKVNPNTGAQSVLGTYISPYALAVAGDGSIFLSDGSTPDNSRVLRLDPTTGAATMVAQGGLFNTNFAGALAFEPSGTLIAASQRDSKFTTSSLVRLTAGGARNLISGNGDNGVTITDSGTTGNVVVGNYIGSDATGNAALGNAISGVKIDQMAAGNTIGGLTSTPATGAGNVISGNTNAGVFLAAAGANNLIEGNIIGPNAAGTATLSHQINGIAINQGQGTLIGGTNSQARNIISGNSLNGINLSTSGTNFAIVIQGNYIGTDITGSQPVANASVGVSIGNSPGTTVGGTTAGAGNVISGNINFGVDIDGPGSGSTVQGNLIGLNAAGTAALGNHLDGIHIAANAPNNTIGGTAFGAGNVISGNFRNGISITGATGTIVQGNLIGTDVTGRAALANSAGVVLTSGATDNTIGGVAPGVQQVIATGGFLNSPEGVAVAANGDVFVMDNGTLKLLRINPQTGAQTVVSSGGLFQTPDGIALAPNGDIYVADATAQAILRVDPITGAQTIVSSGGSFVQPAEVAVAADGTLYVADSLALSGSGAVFQVDPTTGTQTIIGTSPAGEVPADLAIAPNGDLIVVYLPAAGGPGEVDRINSTTGVQTVISSGGLLVQPTALGIDRDGGILVANLNGGNPSLPGNIVRIDPTTGTQSLAYSGAPLAFPIYIHVAPNGDLYATNFDLASNPQLLRIPTNAARNVISGNSSNGIQITDSGSTGNLVEGNYVGTDASGNALLRGTVASYRAEGNANDDLGLNNGSIQGNVTFVPGEVGQAFHFSGNSDYVSFNSRFIFNQPGDATLEFWLRFTPDQHRYVFWTRGDSADTNRYNFFVNPNGTFGFDYRDPLGQLHLLVGAGPGGDPHGGAGVPVDSDTWTHIAITRIGASYSVYKNGTLAANAVDTAPNLPTATGWSISYPSPSSVDFSGNVDEISLYNRALTAAEIQGIYAARNSGKPSALGNRGNGVVITNGAQNNTVGGTAPGTGNVISGQFVVNTAGILIGAPNDFTTTNNTVAGNYIGTDAGGTRAEGNYYGVLVEAYNNIIGGTTAAARNVISGNDRTGVFLEGTSGTPASGNAVQGNFIGTDWTGTTAVGNDIGVETDLTSSNIIGGFTPTPGTGSGNVISGNNGSVFADGVFLAGSDDVVEGNLIGLTADGTGIISNGDGITITGTNNTIGGTYTQARNIISGGSVGLNFSGAGTTGNIVANNYIGTSVAGDKALGSPIYGIILFAPSNTIGLPNAGNVILGQTNGYAMVGSTADHSLFQGNYVGVNAAGNVALSGSAGILFESSSNVTIGGTAAGAANVIAGGGTDDGTGHAVPGTATAYLEFLDGSNELVQGNFIGTDLTGTVGLGCDGGFILDEASNSTVGGTASGAANVISSSRAYGVLVTGYQSTGNLIQGNKIGTNLAGTAALPNATYGVWLDASAANNTLDQNVISGNSSGGVLIDGTGVPDGNIVWYKADGNANNSGNYSAGLVSTINGGVTFGPGKSGQAFQFHNSSGESVTVTDPNQYLSSTAVTVEGWINLNSIPSSGGDYAIANYGLTATGENYGLYVRNDNGTPSLLLEWYNGGFNQVLVDVPGLTTGTYHHVAVTADGTAARFYLDGALAGSAAMSLPLVRTAGSLQIGAARVDLFDGSIDDLAIYNRPLTAAEIQRIYKASGGSKGGSGTSAHTLTGNLIGTNAAGSVALANQGPGVFINGALGNNIGGTVTGAANTIAFNAGAGVAVADKTATGNAIRTNIFHDNALGIDLGNDGVTPNDSQGHVGPNNFQNFPIIGAVYAGPTNSTFKGTLTSTPNTTFTIDFYANNSQDPSGYGEGAIYLGSTMVGTDATGSASFNVLLNAAVTPGQYITATVTDQNGNTSEFSQNLVAPVVNLPIISISGPSTINEGVPVAYVANVTDANAGVSLTYAWTVTQAGNPNFALPGNVVTDQPALGFTPTAQGTYQVQVMVVDSAGAASTATTTLMVGPAGPGVTITGTPFGPTVNTMVNLGSQVTDPAGAAITNYAWSVLLDDQPYDPGTPTTNSTFSFTPSTVGVYAVTLVVTDATGAQGAGLTTFVASSPNPPATIIAPPTGTEGSAINATSVVGDPSLTGPITYAWTALKDGNPFASASGLSNAFTFTPDDQGTYQINLTITDSQGHVGSANPVIVTVGDAAPTPQITSGPLTATVGTPITFTGAGSTPGTLDTDSLTWSVFSSGAGQVIATGSGSSFTYTPSASGLDMVTLTDTDEAGTSSSTSALVAVSLPGISVNLMPQGPTLEGTPSSFEASVANPNPLAAYTFTWSVQGQSNNFATSGPGVTNGSNSTFTFTPPSVGSYLVNVTVLGSDGTSASASLVALAANVGPSVIITGAPPDAVFEGTIITLAAQASDPGGATDTLTYAWTVSGPDNFSQTGSSTNITYVPNEVGSYTASITVTDSSGATATASTSVSITHVNPVPTVRVDVANTVIEPPISKNQSGTITLALIADVPNPGNDDDQLQFNWTATDTDNTVVINTQNGPSPNFTFTGSLEFSYQVTLQVTDEEGGTASVTIPVEVANNNQTMTLSGITGVSEVLGVANAGAKLDGSALTVPFVAAAVGGHDTLIGGSGANVLQGDSGFNSLVGGSGPNTLYGTANDTLIGGAGTSTTLFNLMPGVGEVLQAGSTGNSLSFAQATAGINLNLTENTGQVQNLNDGQGSTLAITGQFQNVVGSAGNDTIYASNNSTLYTGGGNDQLFANNVSNVALVAGASADLAAALGIVGMTDTTQFGASGGNSSLSTSGGSNITVVGGSGNSTLTSSGGSSITLFGGSGNDSISSTDGTGVSLNGGSGNSTLTSSGGASITLFGGSGSSSLSASGGSSVSLSGGSGNSTLTSSGGSSITLFGGTGNDSISSTGGTSVSMSGGSGNSTLTTSGGTSITLFGGSGNDSISTTNGSNVSVQGGSGSSTLSSSGGTNITLFGSSGGSTISSSGGSSVSLLGGSGNSTITATGGTSITLFGGSGNDSLSTTNGINVTVVGGSGNSTLNSSGGTSITLFGGTGNDSLSTTNGTNVSVVGGNGNSTLSSTGGTGITLFGGSGSSTISSSGGSSVSMVGGSGNSTITASGGTSITLFGGSGNDSLSTSNGSNVTVVGGTGNSTITASGGTSITLFGGTGNDSISTTDGSSVSVIAGSGNSTLSSSGGANITLFGSSGNSTISSTGGSSVSLSGGSGNSTITASGGTSITLFGGAGNDSLSTTNGSNVTVVGGTGNSTLSSSGGTSITLFGGTGNDSISSTGGSSVSVVGGSGNSTITASGGTSITLFGGSGNDSLATTNGSNVTVVGGTGNSTLSSSGGTSITLFGGTGNDSISSTGGSSVSVVGGSGNSTLTSSGGSSITLFGGSGNDSLSSTNDTNVTIVGGTGNSTLVSSGGTSITLFGGTGNDSISSTGGSSVSVVGGSGNSTITASGGSSITLFGGTGNDTLSASNLTAATIVGGTGNDFITTNSNTTITLAGGSGSDTIAASGDVTGILVAGGSKGVQLSVAGGTNVSLYGGPGDDTLAAVGGESVYLFGGDGNNTYQLTGTAANPLSVFVNDLNTNGSAFIQTDSLPNGVNTLQFPGVNGITIDLSNFSTGAMPTASQIQQVAPGLSVGLIGQFQNVVGTPGDDSIRGNSGPNVLDAGATGNDTLAGGTGPATLIAGSGNDSLVAGSGGTTYRFPAGTTGSAIVDPPANTGGLNALDFSRFGSEVNLNLGLSTAQSVGGGLSLTLQNPSAIDGYVASAFNDSVTGNSADDRFFVGAGNDTFTGGGGNDTYFFSGSLLGADTITETPTTHNALNFLAFDGPVNLDLTQSSTQAVNPGLNLTLTNPQAFTTVVGTPYSDSIKGNGGNDSLIGAGGQDSLVAGNGNDSLQGDLTQVVYLQFLTSTLPEVHHYTASEQSAILSNLQHIYSAYNYFFTTDQPTAQQQAQATGGHYATLIFNQGPAGGAASELDPGNIDLGGTATINITPFLGDPAQGLVMPSSDNIINLSSTIAAHELGHLSGLQHQDAVGPIGTGIYTGIKPSAFNPVFAGPQNAVETPLDIMASPDSVGTTLQDAAGQTQLGERDAIKLAFNDTGTLLKQSSLATQPVAVIPGVSSAYVVGSLPALTVPNTLMSGTRDFGQTFDVNAVAINGTLATPTQEDFYAITAPAGQLAIQVISGNNTLNSSPIIPELEVLDANGQQVAYNEKEFESLDSTLLDLSLTAGATYYVGVDSYFFLTAGNYQLFLYSFATGAVQSSGDTMVGGSGSDSIQGSSGNDYITFLAGSNGSATINAGSGQDTVNLNPAPGEHVTTTGNVTIQQPPVSPTTASLISSANPSVYGQSVSFTATVTSSTGGTPTGTVSFYDGNAFIDTESLAIISGSDQATLTTSTLAVGSHSITATYNGDLNYATSTSSGVSQTVNQDATSTDLGVDINPSAYGQTITFTATVTASAPGSGTPTGSVNFYDGNTFLGSGTLAVVNGQDQATYQTAALLAGGHSITASYQGDANFTTSTSATLSQTVNPSNTMTSLGSSLNPSIFGQSITFTATVAAVAPGAGTPTGSVNFYDGNTLLGSGTLAVVNGQEQASYQTAALTAGGHNITATYQGDANFATSTSDTLSQTVNPSGTSTSLSSALNPSTYGQSVTFTATIVAVAPGAGTPTGTVNFYDGNALLGSGTLAVVNGQDQATYQTAALTAGGHYISATYQGDANFTNSTSGTLSQTVNQSNTTTLLNSSLNPSTYGQSVTFTATVAAVSPGAGTPTGSVNFYDGNTLLGSGTLAVVNGQDQATYSTSSLSATQHSITATYQGDANFVTSTSGAVTQTVNQASTTTSLGSSQNPSTYGQSVTFTATVAAVAPGAGTPTGSVNFYDGNILLGSATLALVNGQNQATYSTSALTAGGHSVTANYQGDPNFASSTSSAVSQTVNPSATSTSLGSSANPSTYGQSVTFTATVAAVAPGAGTPTGSVNFYDGNTLLGSGTLAVVNGQDQATYQISTLPAGSHSITAKYQGDSNFSGSSSSALGQTVNPAGTTTTGSARGTGYFGQSMTFTATVSANAPSTATVVGSVDFFDSTTNVDLGMMALAAGQASLSLTNLPTGKQTIQLKYLGAGNFATSSTSVTITIVSSVWVLDNSAGKALSLANFSNINLPGLVMVDSSASNALNAADNSSISAGSIQVVGGVKQSKNAKLNPSPKTGAAFAADPMASLAAPTGGTKMGSITIGDHTTRTINPGIYSSISVSSFATLILNPGVYVIAGGGLRITDSGTVKGTGVLIYNAGSKYPNSGGPFGSITLSRSAILNLTPASTGTYAGIAIFQSRDNSKGLSFGDQSSTNLNGGLIYAPAASMTVSSQAIVQHGPIVVDTLALSGTAAVTDQNPGNGLTAPASGLLDNQLFATSLISSTVAPAVPQNAAVAMVGSTSNATTSPAETLPRNALTLSLLGLDAATYSTAAEDLTTEYLAADGFVLYQSPLASKQKQA